MHCDTFNFQAGSPTSKFLTQGNILDKFEKKISRYVGSKYAVAVSSASAGLHISCLALNLGKNCDAILIDIHAEATSEKMAIGHWCDGRVTLAVGTHTHIPTSDYRVLENGTAFISDVGMSGDYDSIIGMEKKISMNRFLNLNTKNSRLEVSKGEPTLCGVLITTHDNGYAKSIKPLRVGGILDKNKFSKE